MRPMHYTRFLGMTRTSQCVDSRSTPYQSSCMGFLSPRSSTKELQERTNFCVSPCVFGKLQHSPNGWLVIYQGRLLKEAEKCGSVCASSGIVAAHLACVVGHERNVTSHCVLVVYLACYRLGAALTTGTLFFEGWRKFGAAGSETDDQWMGIGGKRESAAELITMVE